MIKDAETYAEEDKARREEVEARNRAEALVHTAEKTMSDLGDKADDAVKAEVESGVAELKTALEGNDAADIAAKAETLSAAMMKMGEAAYQAEPEAGEAEAGNTASDGTNDGDDVVDAEFEEVEDDQDAKKA
jgi:molecular chaperone DnaK